MSDMVFELDRILIENQTLRDERDRLQRLINIYAKAKVVFDEGRLREDHHAWKERYQALVSAEDELKAALTPAGQRLTPNEATE